MTKAGTPADAGAILEIDLGAVTGNWRHLKALHGTGDVAGVLKADGYGLGAREIGRALFAAGCRHFFVAHLAEALAIRDAVPGAMLAVLNGLLPGEEDAFGANDIVPVLGSLPQVERWAANARRSSRKLPALLHIDTGMARLGLDQAELTTLASQPQRLDDIAIQYVMTHLVSAELPDDPINHTQRQRFAAACASLPSLPRSLANSSGIFLGEAFRSDLARPGAALYGINPTPMAENPMRPVVTLRGQVLQVREIAGGDGVGYNAMWRAERTSRIATVGIGYADGWLRSLSGRGHAVFDGREVPLVGRVSMDLTTFDVTDFPAVGPGDWLEFLGSDRRADHVAEAAGTNGYEILTSLGRRYRRVYRG